MEEGRYSKSCILRREILPQGGKKHIIGEINKYKQADTRDYQGYLSTENRILPSGWVLGILKGLYYILLHVSISLGIGNRVGIKVRI